MQYYCFSGSWSSLQWSLEQEIDDVQVCVCLGGGGGGGAFIHVHMSSLFLNFKSEEKDTTKGE